jgi:hypothetical protein
MALEYTYYSAARLTTVELRSLVASWLAGSLMPDGEIVREGLRAFAHGTEADEEAAAPALFGFSHGVAVRFRFAANREDLREHNTALMVGVVLAIADRTRADSVLLFNGEEAILQVTGGEVIFSDDWEDWEGAPEAVALKAGHRVGHLAQPLLSDKDQ